MKAMRLTPMLWTENLQETIDFYTNHLDFVCGDRNEEWGWAALHNQEIDIMVANPNEHTPFEKSIFTGSFYFYVEDVESLWAELNENEKVKVFYPIDNFPWGMREFAILDNNGYILQFGEDILP